MSHKKKERSVALFDKLFTLPKSEHSGKEFLIVDNLGQKIIVFVRGSTSGSHVTFVDWDGDRHVVSKMEWQVLRKRAKLLGYK